MGGTEFISQAVAEHFIANNDIVDIFTRGQKKLTYTGVNQHHIGDRLKAEDLISISDIPYDYIIDISAYTRDDVEILVNSINKSALKRYIFCSSGAVYEPSRDMITEDYSKGKNPNWSKYGIDKLQAENYLFSQFRYYHLPITIFRPTYVYGPKNNLYRETYFFDCISKNKAIPYSDSNNKTQFLHIHDLLMIIQSFIENPISIGQAYNVTNEQTFNFDTLLDTYELATGKTIERIGVQKNEHDHPRSYFPYRDVNYCLSIDKLIKHGLHVPKFDLIKGLRQTYEWYLREKPSINDPSMVKVEKMIAKAKSKTNH